MPTDKVLHVELQAGSVDTEMRGNVLGAVQLGFIKVFHKVSHILGAQTDQKDRLSIMINGRILRGGQSGAECPQDLGPLMLNMLVGESVDCGLLKLADVRS